MRVVDLADRYHLTTVEALELCQAAGIDADSSDSELDADQTERWLALAEEQRVWRLRNEAPREDHPDAGPEPEQAGAHHDRAAGAAAPPSAAAEEEPSALGFDADGGFGPIPPPPWELDGEPPDLPATPPVVSRQSDLSEWGAVPPGERSPQISPLAPAAVAFGVLALIFPFVTGLVGFALGHLAKRRIRDSHGTLTGERLATAGQVLSVIGIVLWSGLLAYAVVTDAERTQNRVQFADLQVDDGVIEWDGLAAHQCLRVPRAEISVVEWQRVRCDRPHEAEVMAVQHVRRTEGTPYPGRASFIPVAKEICEPVFESYVGTPYAQSALRMGAAFPSVSNWSAENDDRVACIVFQDDWDYINGTLEGARH